MKVGLTTNFQFSIFSSGSAQTVLAIGETFRLQGHEVSLIAVESGDSPWWEDCKSLAEQWTVVKESDVESSKFDLVIECGGFLLKPEQRCASKHVWLARKAPLLNDIEATLFPFTRPHRNLDRITEVWVQEELCSEDDIQYLELQTRKPVRRIPWVWTPSAIEVHRREVQAPVWSQVAEMDQHRGLPWSIHICETHTSSASSCTIPLFIMRSVKKGGVALLNSTVKIHNADMVKQAKFFQFNVLGHCLSDIQDISCNFIGRQRIVDFVYDPKAILIAHSRFLALRPYIMDALWVGIPVVHNSKLLAGLGGAAEAGYYPDNEIVAGRDAFRRLVALKEGLKAQDALDELLAFRKRLMETVSPMNLDRTGRILAAAHAVLALPAAPAAQLAAAPALVVAALAAPTLRIGFCDMWDAFRADANMFVSMIQGTGVRGCVGINLSTMEAGREDVDLVLFGPFGNRWQSVRSGIPLIHYTGENSEPVTDPRVKLNLGFKRGQDASAYLRLPLWMLEINWFGVDAESYGNPKPIPIDRCCKIVPEELLEHRKKFCAFVVSNPRQPMRNAAFQWLSEYKHVDSAGKLFNNVGDAIFAGLGGGGGELKKLEFLKSYKFCLAYENESFEGYTTEKLLHAKAAGCIPIYWGDSTAEQDIDFKGIIDARGIRTAEELVRAVKEVEEDDIKWLEKYAAPALSAEKRDSARRTLSQVAERLLRLGGCSEEEAARCPRLLGGASDATARAVPAFAVAAAIVPKIQMPTQISSLVSSSVRPPVDPKEFKNLAFVTGTSSSHLPSLQLWLKALIPQRQFAPELRAIVYLLADVSQSAEADLAESYPFAEFRRVPTAAATPADFLDFWDPQHFGWKLWALNEVVNDPEMCGKMILYIDAGVMLCRMPFEWFAEAKEFGLSFLVDPLQDNAHWCSPASQKKMAMTEEELRANQIWAGGIAFLAGHSVATQIFKEAYQWAQQKEVLVGEKWTGVGNDKEPFGHRHDQSILSVLRVRKGLGGFPLYKIHCHMSLRLTYLKGAALYVHRGNFTLHKQIAKGIDSLWCVNLDRRPDRMEKFMTMLRSTAASPSKGELLVSQMLRLPAFDGLKLKLTPKLARLFKPNDFNWKKPVMGCALSHLALWLQLIHDKEDINTYFVCEDDCRLVPDWKRRWEDAHGNLPVDWDLVYLGGLLPPNREGFEAMCVEQVAPGIARVRENSVFGQNPPNRYMHWCTYAYVVNRRGAQKIVEFLKGRDGIWTSADHLMCNIHQILNIYFLHPLPAGCYQDDDPVYQKSAFNDFSRTDSFDSDLWNNTERFSEDEVRAVLKESDPLDLVGALADARDSQKEVMAAAVVPASAPVTAPRAPQVAPTVPTKRRMVTVAGPPMNVNDWYERSYFEEMLVENAGIGLTVERIPDGSPPPSDKPIVVFQRPHVPASIAVLEEWRKAGAEFYILHLSDEFGSDPVANVYSWPECLGVIRNYVRPDIQESEKVKWIPLGWHWSARSGAIVSSGTERPYVWSFVGTGWAGRQAKLQVLEGIPGDHKCVFMDDWNSPKMLGREEMIEIYSKSMCVPCPGGMNAECFRVYEALEAGALPVFVLEEGSKGFLEQLSKWIPLLVADSWSKAAQTIHTLRTKPEVYEQVRAQTLAGWARLTTETKDVIRKVLNV